MNQKTRLNFVIDLILLVLLAGMIGIGLMIKWVLIPGFKIIEMYDTNQAELYFWGMDRHQWGTVHLIFSLAFIVLLVVHLVFHWTQIKGLFRRFIPSRPARVTFVSLFCLLSLALLAVPLLVTPQAGVKERKGYYYRQRQVVENPAEGRFISEELPEQEISREEREQEQISEEEYANQGIHEIAGYQSMYDICQRFGVPVQEARDHFNIPGYISSHHKLGRLKRDYGFELQDFRLFIDEYLVKHK